MTVGRDHIICGPVWLVCSNSKRRADDLHGLRSCDLFALLEPLVLLWLPCYAYSVERLKKAIDEYIHYYNHERIRLKLKSLSPIQYRVQALAA